MNKFAVLLILLVSLIVPVGSFGASVVKITTDASGEGVEVEESFHITIEAINCAGSLDISSLPPGVKVVYRTTRQSSKVTSYNGRTEQINSTSLILTCKGVTPGKYTFGPVSVDGTKSNVVSYKIIPSTGKKARSNSNAGLSNMTQTGPLFVGNGNEEMYLKAYVNKTTAYEQEAIEYTVKLFTTYGDIKFLGAAAAPKFDGFVVEESSDVSNSFKFEDLNGKTFKTAIIARYIIFPQKAGKLKVTGNTYTVSTDARQYYHDPYYQTITVRQPVKLNVTPNDIVIDIKELPTPIPENFIGGVGSFQISSTLPANHLKTNEAATITYTIKGEGNIKYLTFPALGDFLPSSIEVYSPEVSVDANVGSSNVSGSAKFEYSIIPRETGNFKIPSIKLSYFDPADKTYKYIDTREYTLSVSMGEVSSKSQQSLVFNPELLPTGKLMREGLRPYVFSWLYWLWFVVPVILLIVTLFVYRKHLHEREDMVLFRSKNANRMALKRLAAAYKCYKNNQEKEFYDEMLAALWGYLADKLKIPTSQLNRSNVSEEFKEHGVKVSTFQPIINLIDECEYAKYTPVSREANMKQLYTDAVESLSKVESEYEENITPDTDSEEKGDETDYSLGYVNTSDTSDNSDTSLNSENSDNSENTSNHEN